MAPELFIACGSASTAAEADLAFRLTGPKSNVSLEIDDISNAVVDAVPPAFLDLLEMATYVYCADQALNRGAHDVETVGAEWRRNLRFRVPVRVPDLWSDPQTRQLLSATLGFLSDDHYEFDFDHLKKPPQQQYLRGRPGRGADRIEEVVLFSGGLDSLGGAIQEAVVDGRAIALVTHQPTTKMAKHQKALVDGVADRSKFRPLFIPVSVNKDKALGKEYTQRSRSFLYVTLGATVAHLLGLSRVRFYENGVVSLNLPPSPQIIGSKATRTTHPRVLDGFAKILTAVAGHPFAVENPFQWRTKTEVAQDIIAAGGSNLIGLSTSCMHTWEMTNAHPHCGSCSQCIDRRFAVLAANAEAVDPASGYKVDLLTGARQDDEPRTLLSAYVETAKAITKMSPQEFMATFGEVSHSLRYLGETPAVAAKRIYNLYRRHAEQVTSVVTKAVQAHASAIVDRSLPATCLVRLVCDSVVGQLVPGAAPQTLPFAPAPNTFVRTGKAWSVTFDGCAPFVLLPTKGAAYLHMLLQQPGKQVSAASFAASLAAQPESVFLGSTGEVSDAEALRAYRARFAELTADREAAKERGDTLVAEECEKELRQLADRIRKDRDHRGKPRKGADNLDRVRKAVGNAVKRAIQEIAESSPELAEHFSSPRLRLGRRLCYEPPEHVQWVT